MKTGAETTVASEGMAYWNGQGVWLQGEGLHIWKGERTLGKVLRGVYRSKVVNTFA